MGTLTKEDLKQYGTVEICEEISGKLHVKITKGFSNNAMNVFELMDKIGKITERKFPFIEKKEADRGIFDYVLVSQARADAKEKKKANYLSKHGRKGKN